MSSASRGNSCELRLDSTIWRKPHAWRTSISSCSPPNTSAGSAVLMRSNSIYRQITSSRQDLSFVVFRNSLCVAATGICGNAADQIGIEAEAGPNRDPMARPCKGDAYWRETPGKLLSEGEAGVNSVKPWCPRLAGILWRGAGTGTSDDERASSRKVLVL